MAMPTGRLITKTHRQLASSTSTDPRVGPIAPATAPIAPQIATATGSRSRGKARITSASDEGSSAAAPSACTTRKAISTSTVGATAQASEASVNSVVPSRNIFLCPTRSAILPAGTSSAANVIV